MTKTRFYEGKKEKNMSAFIEFAKSNQERYLNLKKK